MPTNVETTLKIKNNQNNYVPLAPRTELKQILDWTMGEFHGPYTVTLTAAGWSNGQQTVAMEGITETDIPYCVKMLSGTQEQMIEQDRAYSRLDPLKGIESLNGQVRFTCSSSSRVPTIDINVQVYWTR